MDLAALLRSHEGKSLEFKRDLSSVEPILKTIIAFANTAGGILLVGVEDGSRRVRGIPDVLAAEEKLANVVAEMISPRLIPEVEIAPWRGKQLLALKVHGSPNRPHHLLRQGPDSGVYVRVGSSNRRADETQIKELRRYGAEGAYDETPLPDLNSEAIDFRLASDLFEAYRKLTREALRGLRMVRQYQGRLVPTIGGIVLFGRERLQRFPDARIVAARFAGTDRSRIRDSVEFSQALPVAAEESIAYVRRQLQVGVRIGPVRRVERYRLPPVALREAVMNAIVHADYAQRGSPIRICVYDDRVEVENPGLLLPGLTVADIRRGVSKLRNRVIARVFHELRMIEQWGSGIQRMCRACSDAGLPEPRLEELASHFRVTLRMERIAKARVDDVERRLIRVLRSGEGLSTAALARAARLSNRATRQRLIGLVGRGLVAEIGSGPNDPKRAYVLTEDADDI